MYGHFSFHSNYFGFMTSEKSLIYYFVIEMGVAHVLFERPIHRDDWEGLGHVGNVSRDKYGVFVAADESC